MKWLIGRSGSDASDSDHAAGPIPFHTKSSATCRNAWCGTIWVTCGRVLRSFRPAGMSNGLIRVDSACGQLCGHVFRRLSMNRNPVVPSLLPHSHCCPSAATAAAPESPNTSSWGILPRLDGSHTSNQSKTPAAPFQSEEREWVTDGYFRDGTDEVDTRTVNSQRVMGYSVPQRVHLQRLQQPRRAPVALGHVSRTLGRGSRREVERLVIKGRYTIETS